MSNQETKWVGQALERTEDGMLLTKGGYFIDDLTLSGVAHAAYVRSPHARAKIRHIDTSRALVHPGVYAVITGEDVAQSTRPQRGRVPLPNSPRVYAIAYEQVRYVGEPVVGIAAVDRATAEDAADLVRVEYEPLPPILDAEQALRPGAPLVFEEIGSNVLWHNTFPYGDVEAAFAEADTVVNERVTIHRYSSTPLETFGVMVQYEPATNSFTIWRHTQQPAQDLHVVAAAFGMSPAQIRLIIPPMGGSFGNKVRPLFIIAAALLAQKAKRPVKWIEDRRESLLALGHAADGIMEMSAAVKADGTVLAIKFRNIENEGAGIDFAGRHNLLMLSNIANCYRLRAVSYEGYSVVTNRCPVVANRGIGKPFMCFAVERMMDAVARTLKLDRAEIRFRNFIQPDEFPYETPGGQTYDSGNYPEMLRKALARVDYEALRREQTEGRTRGRLLAIGIATAVEPGGSNLSDGTATVFTGGLESGQGHATALAQIVADELGLHVNQVRVATTFDSASHPYVMTSGVYSNKFHGHDTVAAIGAARKVRQKLLKRAATLLEANPDDLELSDGRISVRGAPQKGIGVAQVASRAYWSLADEQPDGEPGLEALYYYSNPLARPPDEKKRLRVQLGFASAAHVAVVEVDPETFEIKVLRYVVIHDCGRQINPAIVEGQVHGAAAHGIAAALLEEFIYDENGQLLTTSFMDYLKPTAADLPNIEGDRLETPSPLTLLGTKGVGEGGAVVAPAAITSAVEDALVPLGIEIATLPITPSRLFEVVAAGGKRYENAKK